MEISSRFLSSTCSFQTLYTEFANTTLHALKSNQLLLKARIYSIQRFEETLFYILTVLYSSLVFFSDTL